MSTRVRSAAIGVAAAACCVVGFAFAGDKAQSGSHPAEGSAQMAEAMARCEAHGAINENHEFLKQWAGEWNLKITHWMAPGAPPMVNTSSASSKMVMDGRHLVEKVSGTFDMGDGNPMPFEGMATMGFDNHKQKFYSTWIDNWSTSVMTEWGERNGDVLTMKGEQYNPMFDMVSKTKSIATVVDDNTRKLEMFQTLPDGKMFKMMEIVYTRK